MATNFTFAADCQPSNPEFMACNSRKQGLHHVAQKLMIVGPLGFRISVADTFCRCKFSINTSGIRF
jgi:hypothetical protein